MKYNFSEKNLGTNFRKDIIDNIRNTIQQGISFILLGMPLSGTVTLLRYIATRDFAYFAYIDTQSLKHKTRNDFFLSLYTELGGKNIKKASLNAFDECKKELKKLFALLKKNRGKIVPKDEIFASIWDTPDISDWALDALIYRLRKKPNHQESRICD